MSDKNKHPFQIPKELHGEKESDHLGNTDLKKRWDHIVEGSENDIDLDNMKLPIVELDDEVKAKDMSVRLVDNPEHGQTFKPIVQFTIQEAIEHYKDNPIVMCLAKEEVCRIDSNTIHSTEHKDYNEPWIWAYKYGSSPAESILLYSPGKLSTSYYKAPIMDS